MHELVIAVIAAVIAGIILWILAGLWRGRGAPLKLPGWIRGRRAERSTRKSEERLSRLRRDVVDRAAQLKVVVPLTSSSTVEWTTVRWSNGNEKRHYRDLVMYQRDMRAGRTPISRSEWSPPATPVDRWPADQCTTWLTDHPGPPGRLSVWWAGFRAKLGLERPASDNKEEHDGD